MGRTWVMEAAPCTTLVQTAWRRHHGVSGEETWGGHSWLGAALPVEITGRPRIQIWGGGIGDDCEDQGQGDGKWIGYLDGRDRKSVV